jgi:PAS domain S-box-containing protein
MSRDVAVDARWRSIFENGLDAMLLTAPDGSILAANPAACALLGRSEREICTIGRAGVAVMNEAAARFIADRKRDGRALGVLTLRRKDGTTFLAEVSSAVFADASGAPRTSMTFRDVTERERTRPCQLARHSGDVDEPDEPHRTAARRRVHRRPLRRR